MEGALSNTRWLAESKATQTQGHFARSGLEGAPSGAAGGKLHPLLSCLTCLAWSAAFRQVAILQDPPQFARHPA